MVLWNLSRSFKCIATISLVDAQGATLLLKRQSLCGRKMPDDSKCCRQCLILVRICCVGTRYALRSSLGDNRKHPVAVKSDWVGDSGQKTTSALGYRAVRFLKRLWGSVTPKCTEWGHFLRNRKWWGCILQLGHGLRCTCNFSCVIWTKKLLVLLIFFSWSWWVTDWVEVTKVCLLTTWGSEWLLIITETVYGFNHT